MTIDVGVTIRTRGTCSQIVVAIGTGGVFDLINYMTIGFGVAIRTCGACIAYRHTNRHSLFVKFTDVLHHFFLTNH